MLANSHLHYSVMYNSSNICVIQDSLQKKVKGIGKLQGNLYKLLLPAKKSVPVSNVCAVNTQVPISTVCFVSQLENCQAWHSRLGHTLLHVLKNIEGLSFPENTNKIMPCDVCHYAKHSRSYFPKSLSRASKPFELLHYDLWGPYRHKTYSSCNAFLTIVDDCTRCTWTYLLSSKTQVYTLFQKFLAYVST